MAKKQLDSKYGKVKLLGKNPRKIDEVAFENLKESIRRDPDMMRVRGIVIDENNEVIGGNQRCKALLALGYERIPDDWIVQAVHEDGSPWTEDEKQRFVLKDNNPEGIAGEFDYDAMVKDFSREVMRDSGIDFTNLAEETMKEFTSSDDVADEVEQGEHGEQDPGLQEFISHREKKREDLGQMMDTGFYLGLVFETHEQKMEFLEKAGIPIDKVLFGKFLDADELAKVMDIELTPSGLHFPGTRLKEDLMELAMDNPQEGITADEVNEFTREERSREESETGENGEGADSGEGEHPQGGGEEAEEWYRERGIERGQAISLSENGEDTLL